MRQTILFFLSIFVFLFSSNVWAFDHDFYADKEIALKNPQSAEETFYFELTGDENNPLQLVLKVNQGGADKISVVDHYGVAGGSPRVKAFFNYDVQGKENIFVLISWFINSKGAGAYGDLYQLYAYKRSLQGGFFKNEAISFDSNLSGMDGTLSGESSSFIYQDEESIKNYIDKTYNTQTAHIQNLFELTHCTKEETPIFSCTMRNGKILSVCSKDENKFLTYRYGKQGHIEFVYPTEEISSKKIFSYSHYFRYRTDYFLLIFINQNYQYKVFRFYSDDGSNDEPLVAGVSVTNLISGKEFRNECATIEEGDSIATLRDFLPCNEAADFGCQK